MSRRILVAFAGAEASCGPHHHRDAMATKTIQINRRSRNITEGKSRAPNRSMYYAMGYEEGDFRKPMVGVANGHSTITPCNSGLQKLADAAVEGLKQAGANPQIFGGTQTGANTCGSAPCP